MESAVEILGARRYRVKLNGQFQPGWMAALCTGLGDRRLSIDQAHAVRGGDGGWQAQLELVALAGASDPLNVPYVELARSALSLPRAELQLSKQNVQPALHAGGALLVTLEARDSLGLLGSLLASFAGLMLFPIELQIETRNDRACDSFWLVGVGGSAPSAHARAALERMLGSWMPLRARP
ncbi:MAG TPA: hypothetical protein VHM19_07465 [Polyangiales bacterium]|jgi:hypothetical protein|nr:hypothetical protein [Polyangiales bacterium]